VRRNPYAELLRRVFEVEALVYPHCGGGQWLLAAITAPESIQRLLRVIRARGSTRLQPDETTEAGPARGPPGDAGWWGG